MTSARRARVDERFSSPGAEPTPWPDAEARIVASEVWSISTVRRDGRPHVAPLLAVWDDDALHFCTGPDEQKAINLSTNRACALTAADTSQLGVDIVVEGRAERVTDEDRLRHLAAAWVAKYGEEWRFDVRDHAFAHAAGSIGSDLPVLAHVFEVRPTKILSFAKGGTFAQTTWRS